MKPVVLESPYAGDIERNVSYARACMADCLRRGEAPIASHLLYTQPGVLDDDVPRDRELGIAAGLLWGGFAHAAVFYVDNGWSRGMLFARDHWRDLGMPIELRTLAPCGTRPQGGDDLSAPFTSDAVPAQQGGAQ